jgi:tetratricopeptide (TPR) repeat protein
MVVVEVYMRNIRYLVVLAWVWLAATSTAVLSAEEKHPWIGIANASIFPQRLLNHKNSRGWSDLRLSVFKDAKHAYERSLPVAERLLYTFLWIDLMYKAESDYVSDWVDSMGKANRLHANIPAQIPFFKGVLGERLSDDFLRFFFSRGDIMRDAYNQWDPSDLLTEFFSILDRLYSNNKYLFSQYPNLALAIAYVHDVPPPPLWPHPQVSQNVLPRILRSPDKVFAYFTNQRDARWFHTSIKRLSLSDAIFLVDIIVTPSEVDWVRKNITVEADKYEDVYSLVQYDLRRLQAGQMHWMYNDYSLAAIKKVGGLCVDQAYFASQVGKVQGLPTIEFLGSGLDGRHAWFGYLDFRGKWEMDAGRYADQKFVTGHAFNPQTWVFISDHEIDFLGAGYRKRQAYFRSQVHYYWARILSIIDELEPAQKAAENAVAVERRNSNAWSLLISIRKRMNIPMNRIDATYRSVLSALRTYSDLEAKYLSEFADYLESTGRDNSARLERSRITYKNKNSRSDLAIHNSVDILEESMRNDSPSAQMYVYKRILYQVGSQGGIQVQDELIIPFVNFLLKKGRRRDAKTAILEAEKVLKPAEGSQMASDLRRIKSQVGL